jgi:hypothetical protein
VQVADVALWVRTLWILLLATGGVASASQPQEVFAACRQPVSPVAESERKFNPGHYVAVGRTPAAKGFRNAVSEGVTGIQLRYRWADLEPAEGRYEFAAIGRDLATAAGLGVQLVVLIEDKSFKAEYPTPAYLRERHTLRNRNGGYTAVRWDPFVNDRLIQLVSRLGLQFDCHPHFEGVAFQESALSLDDTVLAAHDYSPEKYRDALTRLLRSAAASVPRSRVFWYMNFLPQKQQYIAEIARALAGTGVVMGGPDVLPDNPALTRRTYPFYEAFRTQLKLFGSMQHNSYRHRRSNAFGTDSSFWSMEELFLFARDRLHVDYVIWEYRTVRQPPGSRNWDDAREVIARHRRFQSNWATSK